jgi:hypothetical protein
LADGQALNSDDILLKKVDAVAVGGPDRWCGTIDQELVKSRPSVLRETFASSEIWKVHVCPIGAGQATWIAANIGVFARQPAFPHPAVALCVLTTNVVFTRASLLRTVCAVAAGVAKSDSMTKANTAIFSKMCRNFICCFRRNLVELKRGAILQRKSWPYNQVRTARTEAITFSAKGTNFHLPQFPKSSYSYLRSAIH